MTRRGMPVRTGLLTLALLGLFLAACSEESSDPVVRSAGRQVDALGCKSAVLDEHRSAPPLDQGCLVWSYDGDTRTLQLIHENAGLNCCPEGEATVTVGSGGIVIDEMPIDGLCDCLCLFDLVFEVTHLPRGRYEVAVQEHYLHEDDLPLVTTIDLTTENTGTFCVPRSRYPWGP